MVITQLCDAIQHVDGHLHAHGKTNHDGLLVGGNEGSHDFVEVIGMLGDGAANGEDGQAIQSALVSLVLPAMSSQTQGDGPLLESSNLFAVALQLVDESLQDIDLGPAYLADQLHTSVRSLYRLFEEHGESVSRYILRTRLSKVAQDLCSHTLRCHSITQIAFKWGFVDVAHFSRAFKRITGQPPGAARNSM